jgi:hypothetical protein
MADVLEVRVTSGAWWKVTAGGQNMSDPNRFWSRISQVVVACGLLAPSGCGSAVEEPDTATAVEPLLKVPGSFYTTAAEYGWCGVALATMSTNCHAGYSANSTGATNSYTRIATGRYRVLFPSLSNGGNVQLGAVGSNARCSLLSTSASAGGVLVDLACRDTAGALVDAKFQVSYYRETNVGGVLGAYALVRTGASPSVSALWNSAGGGATLTNLGTGVHRVTFPGQVFGADTVIVTPASSSAVYCKPASWSPASGGGGVSIDVRCFTFAGVPTNGDFSISYNQNLRAEPRNTLASGTQGGFSLVQSPGIVSSSFSRNTCSSGSNSASQIFVGQYNETFHARSNTGGAEFPTAGLVSAKGSNSAYCNLSAFVVQGNAFADMTAVVKCFSPTGTQVSAEHTTLVMQQAPGAGC